MSSSGDDAVPGHGAAHCVRNRGRVELIRQVRQRGARAGVDGGVVEVVGSLRDDHVWDAVGERAERGARSAVMDDDGGLG
ncbi:MAG: hypothetical protein WBL31_16765 [Ilumatobacteraceae bacterium]